MGEPIHPRDISETLGKNRSTTRVLLANMKQDGQVRDTGQGYTVAHEHKQAKQHKQPEEDLGVGGAAPVYGVYEGKVGHGQRRLTDEQAQRVQRLIHQGMSPKFARAEVLGEGGEL